MQETALINSSHISELQYEVSSFNFNHFCDTKNFTDNLCGGFFINDYYTGNILYFFGAAFMVLSLMLLEKINPNSDFKKSNLPFLIVNSVIFAFAIFAYAAFDRVLVGLIYSLIVMLVADFIFITIRKKYLQYPIITYTAITYSLGTLAALLVKLSSLSL